MSAYHSTADLAPVERKAEDWTPEQEVTYEADALAVTDPYHNDWPETYGY